jgi:hypothetical protein
VRAAVGRDPAEAPGAAAHVEQVLAGNAQPLEDLSVEGDAPPVPALHHFRPVAGALAPEIARWAGVAGSGLPPRLTAQRATPSVIRRRYGGQPYGRWRTWSGASARVPPQSERSSTGSAIDCVIRYATADDVPALRRLVRQGRLRVFCGPALVAEIDGTVGAAVSLADGQVIADPSQPTGVLEPLFRARRDALLAPS